MNKDINKLSTYILEKCKNVTNHEILNNELTITTRISCIYKLLEDLKSLDIEGIISLSLTKIFILILK